MRINRVIIILAGLICLFFANTFSSYQVNAKSSSTNNNVDSWTTQADPQQATLATEETNPDDMSSSTTGSTDSNESNNSQTTEDDQEKKDDEKKDSNDNSLGGIFLGGLLALAGTGITSFFSSREASKQREFQLKNEGIARKEERKKELILYKRKIYTDYIQSLRNVNSFIYNTPNYTSDEFREYEKQVIEGNACVTLISSNDVMTKAGEIAKSVRNGMSVIPDNKILELVELMRKDIEMEDRSEQHSVSIGTRE